MMILLPWLDNSAIKINDSIAVLLELNQFNMEAAQLLLVRFGFERRVFNDIINNTGFLLTDHGGSPFVPGRGIEAVLSV